MKSKLLDYCCSQRFRESIIACIDQVYQVISHYGDYILQSPDFKIWNGLRVCGTGLPLLSLETGFVVGFCKKVFGASNEFDENMDF